MLIERGSRADSEVIDHDLARAIGEAPPRGRPLLKENPGPLELLLRHEVDTCELRIKEPSSSHNRPLQLIPRSQKRQSFVDAKSVVTSGSSVVLRMASIRSWLISSGTNLANHAL